MFTTIIVCVAIYFAFRAYQNRKRTTPLPQPIPRRQQSGDAGEARVDAELRRVFTWLCGDDFYLHPTALLLHHAPGTEFPTAEIDHLAITPFGIFVIETKNWSGRVAAGSTDSTLLVHGLDGRIETRRSPIAQNRAKVGFLRSTLPGLWSVRGLGVFSHDSCDLSAALPLDLIRIGDLANRLRTEKAKFERKGLPAVNVPLAWKAIQSLSIIDEDGAALVAHRRRVQQSELSKTNS